jgi:hypothetical protein
VSNKLYLVTSSTFSHFPFAIKCTTCTTIFSSDRTVARPNSASPTVLKSELSPLPYQHGNEYPTTHHAVLSLQDQLDSSFSFHFDWIISPIQRPSHRIIVPPVGAKLHSATFLNCLIHLDYVHRWLVKHNHQPPSFGILKPAISSGR